MIRTLATWLVALCLETSTQPPLHHILDPADIEPRTVAARDRALLPVPMASA
jgi:hypothetical protein